MLQSKDIAYRYRKDTPVLESISVSVESGSFLAILGVNGCGKSTLLSCFDDILTPQGGDVLLDGRPLKSYKREERARRIAFVTQHSHANRLTVFDALLLGRKPYMRAAPTQEDIEVVDKMVDRMGLAPYALRYVDELSGGEYQKVILARAFVQQTDVLLLDEPTNNLDPANQQEVMRVVREEVDNRGIAAAAVLHDINLALRYCDRICMIQQGRVAALGGHEVVTQASIKDVYGIDADILEHEGHRIVVPR